MTDSRQENTAIIMEILKFFGKDVNLIELYQ
jgi:hypothetical protein